MPMVSNSVQSVNEITTLVSAVLTPNSLEGKTKTNSTLKKCYSNLEF